MTRDPGETSVMAKHVSFTDSIRAAIRSAPLSRYELAKRLDVSQGTLADFVNGRHGIGCELLDALAIELGLRLVIGRPRKARK
jgi:transcriptional regulator with XRE-family HTH domain